MRSASAFTWMDLREDDAQRVREALAAFDEQGMQDPLGFGPVRDAVSEMLFPGTSTVHTRARYLLLVPWVYAALDRDGIRPQDGAVRARQLELNVIESLMRGSEDHDGIIGRQSRHTTRQLPSAIYWGALARWGIRRFPGTRREYIATLNRRRAHHQPEDEVDGHPPGPWHPAMPEPPDGWLDATSIELEPHEAEFLRERILDNTRGTYLALLAVDGRADDWSDLPWTHPLAPTAPPVIARQLHHARLFSQVQVGAGLRYNRDLSALLDTDGYGPLATDYDEALADWVARLDELRDDLHSWDRADFWVTIHSQNPRLSPAVRGFVDWWLDAAIHDPTEAATGPSVGEELVRREAALKGARAKLANRRARERSPAAQGGILLTYRWPQVTRVLRDILEGVARGA